MSYKSYEILKIIMFWFLIFSIFAIAKFEEFYLIALIQEKMCVKQGRHFNFFLGGAKIFLNFSMPPDYWKIGKNSTLYVVIWRYS